MKKNKASDKLLILMGFKKFFRVLIILTIIAFLTGLIVLATGANPYPFVFFLIIGISVIVFLVVIYLLITIIIPSIAKNLSPSQVEKKFCKNCKQEIDYLTKICPYCGVTIKSE